MKKPSRYVAIEDNKAFEAVEEESRKYAEAIYKSVELICAGLSPSDPKMMVYMKSFLGPIENFISPQLHSRMKDLFPK